MPNMLRLTVVSLLLFLGACSPRRPAAGPPDLKAGGGLIGTWIGDDQTSFTFQAGERALWIFSAGATPDTFVIRYRLDARPAPAHLDLSGFDRGPLAGRTLFCIIDAGEGESFRLDCEPGRSDQVRPSEFTGQTRTYRRRP